MDAPGERGRVVPVFPLPNVWLFPSVVLPLHIFEPRYRQMVEDSLDGPGRLVLATLVEGKRSAGTEAPPFHAIAGLGEIGRHEKLPDGRFNLLLVGLARVFVREVPSTRLYRQVEWQPAPEVPVAPERAPALRARLCAALAQRGLAAPSASASLSQLADLLLMRIPLPHAELHAHYAELDLERRIADLLEEHETAPPPGT